MLAEFSSVFPRAKPVKVKCVRDDNNRILSAKLMVLSLDEGIHMHILLDDEEHNDIEDNLNPDDTFELYHKWQAYAAKQGQKHLVDISKLGKVPEPSQKVLDMIEEMKESSDMLVLNIVLGSLEVLLREFKSYPHVVKFAETNVNSIMRRSKCYEAVVTAVGLLRFFSTYVDKNNYSKDLESALNRFPTHQAAILKVFEQLGGVNMIEKINRRIHENGYNNQSPYPRSNDDVVMESIPGDDGIIGKDELGKELFDSSQEVHDPDRTPSSDNFFGRSVGNLDNYLYEEEIMDSNGNSMAAGGMTWERLRALLESDDQRCRRFAIQKCSRALTSSTLVDPESMSMDANIDNLLAGHYDQMNGGGHSASMTSTPRRQNDHSNLKLKDANEAEDLVSSLLRCLRVSIHTPKRDAHDLRLAQALGNELGNKEKREFLDSPAGTPRGTKGVNSTSMASILIGAALATPKTDYESITGTLICIDRISMEWPLQVVNGIMKGFSRLMMTLAHAGDEHPTIVNIATSMVVLIIDQVGWEGSDMKIEDSAIASFLDAAEYNKKVVIALSYLLHRSKANSEFSSSMREESNTPTAPVRGGRRNNKIMPMNNLEEAKNSFEILIQENNFSVLKGLWRWCMGLNKKAKLIALELLSGVSMQENVRAFLVKFEGVSKLISLIPVSSDNRAPSAGGDKFGVDLAAIRFIVKTVVNVCATSEKAKEVVRNKISSIQIGPNKVKMADLMDRDEGIRFYMNMLK